MAEGFTDAELRMTALAVAAESAVEGQTTGGILMAAEQVYKFLTGGTVVTTDGLVRVVSVEDIARRETGVLH